MCSEGRPRPDGPTTRTAPRHAGRGLTLGLIGLLLSASPAAAQPDGPGPTLALGGDVLHEAPLAYQLRQREREVGVEAAVREIFVDLAPTFQAADLTVVNLETPIAERTRERESMAHAAVFTAPEAFLDAMREAGVDVVSVANNHAFDQGLEGLRSTLEAARSRGILTVGAGEDRTSAAQARTVEVEGARIAFAGWTEGTNHRPRASEGERPRIAFLRDETIESSLRAARGSDAHLVVALFHWTQEDLTRPRPMMRELAVRAAEAGADLVVGHGPHVPGSTELIETSDGRRVHVLYSLGNLVGAMQDPGGTLDTRVVGVRDAPVALVRTRWRGRRLEVRAVELVHHWISRPTGRAPWLEGGRLHVLRTMNIRAELARLEASACGPPCDERTAQLLRRVRLAESAMARLDDGLVSGARIASLGAFRPPSARTAAMVNTALVNTAPTNPALENTALANTELDDAALVDAPPGSSALADAPAGHAPAPEPEELAAREAPEASDEPVLPPEPVVEPAPPAVAAPAPTPALPPDVDPAVRPYIAGVRLSATFREGAAAESTIDEAQVGAIAALLRADRRLRVEVVGHSTATEHAQRQTLGRLRARRVMGLIAMRGPSRSRFEATGGAPGEAGVVVRIVPRP